MEKTKAPWYYLLLVILAGETIFFLPYVLSRVFRPTILDVFQIDNVELGICFSVYGFVAIASYLFGGPIADRYPARKLISLALWLTALGGVYYASYPSYFGLKVLYGYWGFTSVFLFWAPMIKAARLWGTSHSQLRAFGFLEGGRGLVGAAMGTLGVLVFAFFMGQGISSPSLEESRMAFQPVIYSSSIIVSLSGVLVWFFMRLDDEQERKVVVNEISIKQLKVVLKMRSVLLLMIIVLCAYMGYKTTDVISLFSKEVMSYNDVKSAQVATFLLCARPIVALLLALFFIRIRITLLLSFGFVVSFFAALIFALGLVTHSTIFLFVLSIIMLSIGVYGLRALYFAVMEKGNIPLVYTGTAVGLISIIGYAPDIFSGPMTGYFLDQYSGIQGYQYVFAVLAFFSCIGAIASWRFHRLFGKTKNNSTE